MTEGMQGSGALALEVDGSALPIEFAADEAAARIAAKLAKGKKLRVQVNPGEDADTEGHQLARSAWVNIQILDEEDDTEGHAISVHFPSAGDAKAFRDRLILTGVLAGTLTLGGLAAGAAISQGPAATGVPAPGPAAEVTDSWAMSGVPGSATAMANQLSDSWQRQETPGAAAAGSIDASQVSDSWQRQDTKGAANTAAPGDASQLTDSWQRQDTPGAGGAGGGAEDAES